MIKPGYILCMFLLVIGATSNAQDSLRTLSASQLVHLVKQYHPVARQANLLIEKARAEVTIARADFDPAFYNSTAEKTFDGLAYYKYNRPELTIPTWFGIEIYAGLENLSGSRTNPVETTGETSYLGLSLPLAKDLLMDKRRAALQTAKIYRTASHAEKRNIVNNLLLEAIKTYWYWVQSYQVFKTIEESVFVNEKRMQLVRLSYQLGDRPAIDTTEALAQLQSFQVLRENAWLEFQNAGLELSVFLWNEKNIPVSLPADVIASDDTLLVTASSLPLPVLGELLEAARNNHPELQLYNFKLDALAIEKKLKFQELLPAVNFRYNQLGKGYDILKTAGSPMFENNFQYGLTIGIPLRLSQGRGEYKMAKLKINETELQQTVKRLQVENKVRAYFNELTALKKQIEVQERAYRSYLTLQRGEEIRFKAGESSLFLVNTRENKSLEAMQKLQELRAKYLVITNSLLWAAGLLQP